jgi:hypothetical protein
MLSMGTPFGEVGDKALCELAVDVHQVNAWA